MAKKKIVSFNDFNNDVEKEELKKIRRGFSKNDVEKQQIIGNSKMVFNKVTRKIDDLTPAMLQDKIDSLESKLEHHDPIYNVEDELNQDGWERVEAMSKGNGDLSILAKAILDIASR